MPAGAFLAGAFLAGAFLAGVFFAGVFFAGAFAAFLAGCFLAGGLGVPSGSPTGRSCGSAMRPLLCSFSVCLGSLIGSRSTRVPSCQDPVGRHLGYLGSWAG
ncbi:hypothetical protein C3469_14755 [Mycobacterium kansasii]|nr:hypothetical protein C3475_19865 [Mycobacterium kansasii]POX74570.1 hypothetical protein C3471_23375 [Mycobacterium kansasii]POX80669.1 hypothetical protein C3470_16570 [Mycobacterium kansasii]POX83716.1 hypothetical protein C3B43_24545 [Mycobacterium kansasii]POX93224.1 hypothetical protein C3473_18000 [Mycobacterium kansasii]